MENVVHENKKAIPEAIPIDENGIRNHLDWFGAAVGGKYAQCIIECRSLQAI